MVSTEKRPVKPLPYVILKDVESEYIDWLWYPYIPKGALSMIVGDGGYGKSWMTCAITADLSMGRPLPGQAAQDPQRVLMISAEDGVSQIIKPKLDLLNADMSRIAVFDEGFNLSEATVEQVHLAVKEFDVTVVFFDPMVAYMGGGLDMHKANDTRDVLKLLSKMAKETNTAVVGVHHVKKAASAIAQHKTLGSVDFVNGTRSTLLVDVSKTGQYYMSHVKSNWSKKGPPLAYSMENDRFQWLGEYSGTVSAEEEVSRTPRGKAKSFLVAMLRSGPVAALEVIKLGEQEGINERTLSRAKKGTVHSFQKDRVWFWELEPGADPFPEAIGQGPALELKVLADKQPELTIAKAQAEENEANLVAMETEMQRLIRQAKEKVAAKAHDK